MRNLFCILLILVVSISNAYSQEENISKYLPELNYSVKDIMLSGYIKVPPTYNVIPFVKYKYIGDGVYWGKNDSLETIESDKVKRGTKEIIDPVFVAKLSYGMNQQSIEKAAKDGVYGSIVAQASNYGILNIKAEHLSIGNLPVLEITGERKDGRFFAMAWIGLNSETNATIFIDYRVPFKNDPKSVAEMWNTFIHQSKIESKKR
jgi:hypothetical protein